MSVKDHQKSKYHIRTINSRIPRESIPSMTNFQGQELTYEGALRDLQQMEYEMERIRHRIRATRYELQSHDGSIQSAGDRLNILLQELGRLRQQLESMSNEY